jgi:hypothetical protein|tara:strand:+ start:7182 stop:7298 length:117 start_codon:yes stop_codon:yes gene_type:complete
MIKSSIKLGTIMENNKNMAIISTKKYTIIKIIKLPINK